MPAVHNPEQLDSDGLFNGIHKPNGSLQQANIKFTGAAHQQVELRSTTEHYLDSGPAVQSLQCSSITFDINLNAFSINL